jgi:hypothetical protein
MPRLLIAACCALLVAAAASRSDGQSRASSQSGRADPAVAHAADLVAAGQRVFRFDTFGDEQFWGGALKLHQAKSL